MLQTVTRLAIAAPRRVIAVAVFIAALSAFFGLPVVGSLSAGGFQDPTSESARATALLTEKFQQTDQKLIIVVTAPGGVRSGPARRVAGDIVDHLEQSPVVFNVSSAWTSPPQAAGKLVSKDRASGLIVANLEGGETTAQKHAAELSRELVHDRDGVTVRDGGMAAVYAQINQQNERDLLVMESIAIPLSFAVLVWVFGGLVAAVLPIVLGALAIVGTMSVLRLISFVTEVSTYALDLCVAMGLALAIDYTLLIVSRYREQLAVDSDRDEALVRTMATAGRTVLFSATTVALSMATMALFPMPLLKSAAYAIVATAAIVAAATTVLTPALIAALGPRLDALDLHRVVRRILPSVRWRPHDMPHSISSMFWYRTTKYVQRRAVPVGLAVVVVLLLLGAPFLGVRWGFPDERVLPTSAPARQVADMLEDDFTSDVGMTISVVVPDAAGLRTTDLTRYALELSDVPDVAAVTGPTGTFVSGHRTGPPAAPTGIADGSVFLSVQSTAEPFSQASTDQLDRLHELSGPGGRAVQLAGLAQTNRDSIEAIGTRLPAVLVLIGLITFALLFVLTGSSVLPLQALACNVLSLTAAFGAMVWIFQDGHLGALGTTPTGTLNANIPVLLFCIAFGLSMDYEMFLVSRIHEYWLASGARQRHPSTAEARAANDESAALGLAGIGRVVTAAALVMSISFAALIPAHVSFMRMLGLGLTLAVLADATLVRMVLVPAFIHLAGPWTWWSPGPLARLHQRFAPGEAGVARVGRRRWAADLSQSTVADGHLPDHALAKPG